MLFSDKFSDYFCLALFHCNLQFLIRSDFLFWKLLVFKWFSAHFAMKCLLQIYIDHLELISSLVKLPKFSTCFFKQIICFSACLQTFATIFINTFSSCMSSFKENSRLFRKCLEVSFLILSEFKQISYFILPPKSSESF